jgi:prepilin-type N-terminal cleavage/methylation domain-containing protein
MQDLRKSRGFTLIELVVSIAIFAVMTALVVARYGTFNQNTLLTNVAYDMALTVRTAQSYGLSVKSSDSASNSFGAAYGVHLDMSKPTKFTLFADTNKNGYYDPTSPGIDQPITTYTLTSGVTISKICLAVTQSSCQSPSPNLLTSSDALDITFRRPNPDAILYCVSNANAGATCSIIATVSIGNAPPNINPVTQPIAFITLTSSDKSSSQVVIVRRNGQISVNN